MDKGVVHSYTKLYVAILVFKNHREVGNTKKKKKLVGSPAISKRYRIVPTHTQRKNGEPE
jgi:hypothetical protein